MKFLTHKLNLLNIVIGTTTEDTSYLHELHDENFSTHIQYGMHFVKFYSPQCIHCIRLEPAWNELAKYFKDDETFPIISEIDCLTYRKLCRDWNIRAYPTMLWIEDGIALRKYLGSRSTGDLINFVLINNANTEKRSNLEGLNVNELNSYNFEISIQNRVTFVMFCIPRSSKCHRMLPVWNQIAEDFVDLYNVKFGSVDCSIGKSEKLCQKLDIFEYPIVYVFKYGKFSGLYKGSRTYDAIKSFIIEYTKHSEL